MQAVFWLIDAVLGLVWWLVIFNVIFSWLYAFNVVNSSNQFVSQIGSMLYQLTEPLMRPIRRFMPNLGAIDISPIIVLLLIAFLRIFLRTSVAPAFGVFSY